jgi:hypothetical protein
MNELMADVEKALLAHPSMEPVKQGGGVLILGELEDFPPQAKTPCVVLVDPGAHAYTHLSSGVLDRVMTLEVVVVQRSMDYRADMAIGGPTDIGIEDLATLVRKVLDNNRLDAKYVWAFVVSSGKPKPFKTNNPQLLGKPLTFDYRRIESP